jgi:hypothetical protein
VCFKSNLNRKTRPDKVRRTTVLGGIDSVDNLRNRDTERSSHMSKLQSKNKKSGDPFRKYHPTPAVATTVQVLSKSRSAARPAMTPPDPKIRAATYGTLESQHTWILSAPLSCRIPFLYLSIPSREDSLSNAVVAGSTRRDRGRHGGKSLGSARINNPARVSYSIEMS